MITRGQASLMLLETALFLLPLRAQEAGKSTEPGGESRMKEADVFRSPFASPTEPGSLIRYAGDSQMDFGLALPLSLYSADVGKSSFEVGLRPGILSRFKTIGDQLELKAVDFRLGVPLAVSKGNWSARAELFHLSSHRGADLAEAKDTPQFSFSREAVQTLVTYGHKGRWRVYAGPTFVLRTHPSVERWTLQAGMEWFPTLFSHPHVRLYLASDFQSREEAHWNANISVEPGILFTASDGQPIARLGAWIYRGQVPFGQFFQEREEQAGVQLIIELRPSTKSLLGRRK